MIAPPTSLLAREGKGRSGLYGCTAFGKSILVDYLGQGVEKVHKSAEEMEHLYHTRA